MRRHLLIVPIFVLALVLYPGAASAASLSAEPDTATVSVGDSVGVTVYLNAAGSSVNASDGTLSFSPALLEAQSVAYSNSIFTLWAETPSFNNSSGIVSWSGGSSAPFSGSRGRVLRVVFTAKKAGTVTLALPSASIYADDGLGTNVATAPSVLPLTIIAKQPLPPPVESLPPVASKEILLTSATHPSENEWYRTTVATLSWQVPAKVDAVATLLSAQEQATPSVTYRPAIREKTIDDLEDGIWYFNIRAHYADGWGPTSSYRLKIDTVPPILSAASVTYDAATAALSVFAAATDALSGVRDYTLLADGETLTTFSPSDVANGSFRVTPSQLSHAPALSEGSHNLVVRAFDAAGNQVDSKAFVITVPPETIKRSAFSNWFGSLGSGALPLLIAILLCIVSISMSAVLWMRLKVHERRMIRGVDIRKIRSLTINQLALFKKDVAREARVLDRAHLRRDITPEEAEELQKMRQRLTDLEQYIENQIHSIEKN